MTVVNTDAYTFYTVAELAAELADAPSSGTNGGGFAARLLRLEGALSAPDYVDFGRRLFAARAVASPPDERVAYAGTLGLAAEIISHSDRAIEISRSGRAERKVVRFVAEDSFVDILIVGELLGIRVATAQNPTSDVVSTHCAGLETSDAVFILTQTREGDVQGTAWGRGQGFSPIAGEDRWASTGDVGSALSESWLATQLIALVGERA